MFKGGEKVSSSLYMVSLKYPYYPCFKPETVGLLYLKYIKMRNTSISETAQQSVF